MDLEAPQNVWDGAYGNIYSGYFKPPATASYRFYMSCDDICALYLGNETLNTTNPNKILEVKSYTGYRSYITIEGFYMSAWLNLTKDDMLYIEMRHFSGWGGNHATVSVEISDPTLEPGHHHTKREM
jgi:hypothetical protein